MEGLTIPTIDGLVREQMRKIEELDSTPVKIPTSLSRTLSLILNERYGAGIPLVTLYDCWSVMVDPSKEPDSRALIQAVIAVRDALREYDENVLSPIIQANAAEKARLEAVVRELSGERKRKEQEIHDHAADHWEASVKKQKTEAPAEPKT